MTAAAGPKGGYRPYAELGAWLVVVLGFWIYAELTDRSIPRYEFQLMTWPRGTLYLIAVAAVLNFFFALPATEEEQPSEPDVEEGGTAARWGRLAAIFGLPLVYLWFLPRVGFYVATLVYIPAYMYVFRQVKLVHLLGTGLVIYLFVALVFTRFLYIPFPTGNWPGFYEANIHVVEFLRAR